MTTISLSFGLLNVSIFSRNNFHTNSVPDLSFLLIIVPSRITDWLTKTLPELNNDYDNPLEMRRENTTWVNIELHPSMIPFVTQFKVEEDDEGNRKVLVTYANINHNTLIFRKCAEITNNLAGDPMKKGFTQEPQIGQGLELFFYNWNKASCLTLHTVYTLSSLHFSCLIYFLNPSSPHAK